MHAGSWRRRPEQGNRYLSYAELAEELIPYVVDLGFTHIQLMPISEYPFDGSWGYQPIGMFAPTIRYGTPDEFRYFVDRCHQHGIGVLLDWVPGHFPTDQHGLGRFDGSCLYEHEDPRRGFHPDWNTLIYNYSRNEVKSYLISNANYWIDKYHADGLRVDAVASMLYLDYSRNEGEWIPNQYGGRENLEAISFLKEMNEEVYSSFPGTITIAEESTAWPMVSKPTYIGGLGFGMKWMMGWMNDTLRYFSKDPIYRQYHQNDITFSLHYAFTENFMLPLSHDEVVHGKGSLCLARPGSANTGHRSLHFIVINDLERLVGEIAVQGFYLEQHVHAYCKISLRCIVVNQVDLVAPGLHERLAAGFGAHKDCVVPDDEQQRFVLSTAGTTGPFKGSLHQCLAVCGQLADIRRSERQMHATSRSRVAVPTFSASVEGCQRRQETRVCNSL